MAWLYNVGRVRSFSNLCFDSFTDSLTYSLASRYFNTVMGDVLPYASKAGIANINMQDIPSDQNGPLIGFLSDALKQCSGYTATK